jgi:hypothetical protein
MKALLALGLAFVGIVSFAGHGTKAKEREENAIVEQNASRLELSIVSQKRSYKRTDQFKMQVMLRNPGEEDVYIFGTLDWGFSASLMFYIRDASGKEIEPVLVPDSPPFGIPDDRSAFVKLRPDHFLGTSYFAPLKLMSLTRPGRYAIFVEYNSPVSTADVDLKPFFGKENGTIKSNVVWIEVVR